MARGRKPQPKPAPSNVSKDTFLAFLTDIDGTKQKVADAQTIHARAFKKCESLGIHPEVAKQIYKLAKMAGAKRSDWLRAFDQLRAYMDWDAQLDLLEHAADDAAEDGAEDALQLDKDGGLPFADGEEESDSGPAELRLDDSGERTDADPLLEETTAEWDAVEGVDLDTDALDKSGEIFAAGKEAGLLGAKPEESEHEPGSQAAEIWERGRAAGAKERSFDINQAGHKAGYEGQPLSVNPHDADSEDGVMWASGHEGGAIRRRNEGKGEGAANVVNLFDDGEEAPDAPVIANGHTAGDSASAATA